MCSKIFTWQVIGGSLQAQIIKLYSESEKKTTCYENTNQNGFKSNQIIHSECYFIPDNALAPRHTHRHMHTNQHTPKCSHAQQHKHNDMNTRTHANMHTHTPEQVKVWVKLMPTPNPPPHIHTWTCTHPQIHTNAHTGTKTWVLTCGWGCRVAIRLETKNIRNIFFDCSETNKNSKCLKPHRERKYKQTQKLEKNWYFKIELCRLLKVIAPVKLPLNLLLTEFLWRLHFSDSVVFRVSCQYALKLHSGNNAKWEPQEVEMSN